MDIVMNIIQGLVGLAMLAAGGMKTMQAKEQLIANSMDWAEDFSDQQVKLIGVAELLAGIALVLSIFITSPAALLLGGIAAVCLAVLMGGAAYTHVRRGDAMGATAPSIVIGILSLIVAWSLLV